MRNAIVPILATLFALCDVQSAISTVASVAVGADMDRPTISLSRSDATTAKIEFAGGTLVSADDISGPWRAVTNVSSPVNVDLKSGMRFFRAVAVPGIFNSSAVVDLLVTGPLRAHFDLAFAGTPDGIFPPKREKPYFDAVVNIGNMEIPVSLRVRGNSSLQECPFPKLKFKVSRENRAGTPFSEAREIKIGTHCAEGGRGNIGRMRDERAGFREGLAYEVMQVLGFAAPSIRRARLTYRDTTPHSEANPGSCCPVTREGLLIEDVEVMAARWGGRALTDEEIAGLTKSDLDARGMVDLAFLHILFGNWDYSLDVGGRGLWNTEVIVLAGGKYLPVAGDFDLASWVTEFTRRSAPNDYRPDLPDLDREMRYRLETLRANAGVALFSDARSLFLAHQLRIDALINTAIIDEGGRVNAKRHSVSFFASLMEFSK